MPFARPYVLCAGSNASTCPTNKPLPFAFVTAMVKGGTAGFALKGGDATDAGGLATMWDGPRPAGGYQPMRKQGAIVLGVGGDNSNSGVGSFFEVRRCSSGTERRGRRIGLWGSPRTCTQGAITSGYSTDAADEAVHANIARAGYALPGRR